MGGGGGGGGGGPIRRGGRGGGGDDVSGRLAGQTALLLLLCAFRLCRELYVLTIIWPLQLSLNRGRAAAAPALRAPRRACVRSSWPRERVGTATPAYLHTGEL